MVLLDQRIVQQEEPENAALEKPVVGPLVLIAAKTSLLPVVVSDKHNVFHHRSRFKVAKLITSYDSDPKRFVPVSGPHTEPVVRLLV